MACLSATANETKRIEEVITAEKMNRERLLQLVEDKQAVLM